MQKKELVAYLDDYLKIAEFKDYGPQGLQVEAEKRDIQRIALSVDVAPPIIEMAQTWGADMLIAHHGIFWGPAQPIAGGHGQRVRMLLKHDIHLYAAHLALDGHSEVGNNAVLARKMGVEVGSWWCAPKGMPIGVLGTVPAGITLDAFTDRVASHLHITPRVLAHGPTEIRDVAIVSGFGASSIAEAKALGADTFLTGETSHANYWEAADHQINVIYTGHYASETVGVQALGEHLAQRFGLDVTFFDFPTQM